MEWPDFGKRVRQRREELGISQQDIAIALKIDQAKVSLIERGARKVDLVKELPSLAKVLRCPITYFYPGLETEDDDPIAALISMYLPDVHFEDFEKRKLAKFLESFLQTYVDTMEPKEKASNQ